MLRHIGSSWDSDPVQGRSAAAGSYMPSPPLSSSSARTRQNGIETSSRPKKAVYRGRSAVGFIREH